ncbi:hypothetical protein ACA910_013798 [Epithemia clementina (nom. ined.)]
MALGIPGTRGLFSHLQLALVPNCSCSTIPLNRNARDALADFATIAIATDIESRPTCIAEVIPTAPRFVGACDAAPIGTAGIWLPLPHTAHLQPPIIWRHTTPPCLLPAITTSDNPSSTITINNLELTATLMHADILASCMDIP